jgi:hypothetical protein
VVRPRRTPTSRSTSDYRHDARHKNNPPVGMAVYEAKTAEQPRTHYGHDPHLSPQLIWAGKPGLVNHTGPLSNRRRILFGVHAVAQQHLPDESPCQALPRWVTSGTTR